MIDSAIEAILVSGIVTTMTVSVICSISYYAVKRDISKRHYGNYGNFNFGPSHLKCDNRGYHAITIR